jgi:hypothetical protein
VGGEPDNRTRTRIAFQIILLAFAGIAVLSIVAIIASNDRAHTTELVFSSVLPLLGTWVGTVLAFYFARENLQAATDNTIRLQQSTETSTPVTSVMIPESDIQAFDLGTNDTPDAVKLTDLHAAMRGISPPSRRLPIRNAAGAVLYVVHDSTLTAYAESVHETTATLSKTLGDMLADDDFKALITAIGFVSSKSTVAEARAKMGSIKNCNDVFVTQSGQPEERAVGWLTNTLLAGIQ